LLLGPLVRGGRGIRVLEPLGRKLEAFDVIEGQLRSDRFDLVVDADDERGGNRDDQGCGE
jgi:hypothetical protein